MIEWKTREQGTGYRVQGTGVREYGVGRRVNLSPLRARRGGSAEPGVVF